MKNAVAAILWASAVLGATPVLKFQPRNARHVMNALRGGQTLAEAEAAAAVEAEAEPEFSPDDPVRLIQSEIDLEEELEAAGPKLVVLDYFASWCGPCKKIAPFYESLARKHGAKVVFLKADVDASRELASAQGVKSMPTFQFFRNGAKVDQISGADKVALREKVEAATKSALVRALSGSTLIATAVALYVVFPWHRAMEWM